MNGDLITSYFDYEDLLASATPTELKRLFTLVGEGKLEGPPI